MKSKETFVHLFLECEPAVRMFVQTIVRDVEATEEILQNTAIVLWEKYSEVSEKDEFRRVLFSTAKFKILSWRRDKAREKLIFDDATIDLLTTEAQRSQSETTTRQELLNEAVATLSDIERQLLIEAYSAPGKIKEMALASGNTPMAIYKKLQKIRKKIYDYLNQKEER